MSATSPVRIGTRGSPLALWQARTVAGLLDSRGVATAIVVIRTAGDRLQEAPLSEVGGKRLFVKEIEDALLRRDVDLAVHSAKDMPADLPAGLAIAAALPREDPRDAIVLPQGVSATEIDGALAHLGGSPRIGTSSVRRRAQLAAIMPGASFSAIRGNVDTRLRKLDGGDCQALVLASAGLRRLGFGARISASIPVDCCIPAPGQGIVAVEIRDDDDRLREALRAIHDEPAGVALAAERALVSALGGGCQLPLGGLAGQDDGELAMHAIVTSLDGNRVVRCRVHGAVSDPEALGRRAARELAERGATDILDEVRQV
jgi:hydroxymethylbilane synthase